MFKLSREASLGYPMSYSKLVHCVRCHRDGRGHRFQLYNRREISLCKMCLAALFKKEGLVA